MDKKIIAIAVAAIVIVAGAATFFALNSNKDNSSDVFNVISRVNSEGSGVYINESLITYSGDIPMRNGVAFYSILGDGSYDVSTANAAAWGGLVFGTPGTSSIQHTQIAQIANELGLPFTLYTTGTSKDSGTIYYDSGVTNYDLAKANTVIDGGIIWEPQYQRIIQEDARYTGLALTNDLFSGHTCCVIAGNHDYMADHSETVEKFLAGYAQAVNAINDIISKGTATGATAEDVAAYNEFVAFVKTKTAGLNDDEIKQALSNITYLYADGADGSLSTLKSNIAELVKNLDNIGAITGKYSDAMTFADAFVDDTYMKSALANAGTFDDSTTATINVAVISGDIHQIAIHYAMSKEYFSQYGLTIQISTATNGAGVATSLLNGETQFGFLGAPPATITTINSGLISV